ncbi:MAG: hypothetical protein Q9162_006287 [Coniocarpon cinnabarinum]
MSLPRPIRNLLVANRGEIAVRIINTAREHDPPLSVFTVFTPNDTAHTLSLPPSHALELSSVKDYLDIALIISLAKQHHIDAVHPGYGFLAESADFASQMWAQARVTVIGPGADILACTGDKLAARALAEECDVPVLPAMTQPVKQAEDVRAFVDKFGLPVILKAVDGGGGRGIRLVEKHTDLEGAVNGALAESPSNRIFVEKAALRGFRHIEVQIIGDGTGKVAHLWERECSIQRRYQKVIEMAPSSIRQKCGNLVARMIDSAVRMASTLKYRSLGTFEFLASPLTSEYFFLEINPRLQVEHTVTEQIASVDLVNLQLHIAQGGSLGNYKNPTVLTNIDKPQAELALLPPATKALQLRITAEDPSRSFAPSTGTIDGFSLPSGNGIRVDSGLASQQRNLVSPDFDSLLAKVIVTGNSWSETRRKARRALEDIDFDALKTNTDLLRAIVVSQDFANYDCDTRWLELNASDLMKAYPHAKERRPSTRLSQVATPENVSSVFSSSALLRKGDGWNIALEPQSLTHIDGAVPSNHFLKLDRVLRNDFPRLVVADVSYSMPKAEGQLQFRMTVNATSASASDTSNSSARRGDPTNPRHVITPFSGTLVEVLVDEGDQVEPGQIICIIKQMKMELEVRAQAQQRGVATWVTNIEDGANIGEGVLVAELESGQDRLKTTAKI